jgi:hypothetical protein
MQFILFLDEVGAEFTKARTTRKDIVAAVRRRLLRFCPQVIRPVEVIDEKGSARAAAGGFVLLGPLGAALGVLTGKGPQVLFELIEADGTVRRGIIAQTNFADLRREVERMQNYTPGDPGKTFVTALGFLLLLALCVGATGPAGLVIGPVLWLSADWLIRRLGKRREAA